MSEETTKMDERIEMCSDYTTTEGVNIEVES